MTDYYRQLAEEGDDNYAATLGNLYLQGSRLVDQDLAQAERFLRLAAKNGHVHSSARVGLLIAEGRIADGDLRNRISAHKMDAAAFALTIRRAEQEAAQSVLDALGHAQENA